MCGCHHVFPSIELRVSGFYPSVQMQCGRAIVVLHGLVKFRSPSSSPRKSGPVGVPVNGIPNRLLGN
jgi:hypothetical protein